MRIAHVSQIDTFVTDRCDNDDFRLLLETNKVRLIEAGTGESTAQ
jgi:DeoR/GlpR family transcriptional regulator of sugar metabolism